MELLDEHTRIGLEKIDADAWYDWCSHVPTEVAQTLKLSWERRDDCVLSTCLVSDSPLSNRALGLGTEQPCTPAALNDIAQRFISHGLKNFAVQISPFARMTGSMPLVESLAQAGLVERSRSPKLLRGTQALVPIQSACIARKLSDDEGALFGDVSARGWGRPPIVGQWMGAAVGKPGWHHYVGYLGDQPTGVGATYIDGKFAWLGIGSTLPEYRNQGSQSVLIAQRIADALAMGCEYLVAETEKINASSQNLMRAGFKLIYERVNYSVPLEQ